MAMSTAMPKNPAMTATLATVASMPLAGDTTQATMESAPTNTQARATMPRHRSTTHRHR